jgi:glycosyltransferase involved in cell wall biosynthesis
LRSRLIFEKNATIIQVRSLNIQKVNNLEKLISTLTIPFLFKRKLKKYITDFNFEFIIYTTPPITFNSLVLWLKKKCNSKTYLLLKDIFPQNAVDLGLFQKNGIIHKYFLLQEKKLYELSDRIGCMSQANLEYIINKFPELNTKIEVNPNSIDLELLPEVSNDKKAYRSYYEFPVNSIVFLYAGNLGLPQGVEFLLEIIKKADYKCPNAYFVIVGDGTEFNVIENYFNQNKPLNARLINRLPKLEFDKLASVCDIGMILLKKDFTIPNFPSRTLSYLKIGCQ